MSLRSWGMRKRLESLARSAAMSPWVTRTEIVKLDEANEQAFALTVHKADGDKEQRIDVSVNRAGLWEVTRWNREDEFSHWAEEEPKTLFGFGGPLTYMAEPRDVHQGLELYFIARP